MQAFISYRSHEANLKKMLVAIITQTQKVSSTMPAIDAKVLSLSSLKNHDLHFNSQTWRNWNAAQEILLRKFFQ